MRVLHVVPCLEQASGGPSRAAVDLCRALVEEGVDVCVATTRDPLERFPLTAHGDLADLIRLFPRWRVNRFGYAPALGKWLRAEVGAFDVVHSHCLFMYSSLAAGTAAIRAGVPLIVRPAGMLDPWSLEQGRVKKRLWLRLVEGRAVHQAAAIHATSAAEAEAIRVSGLTNAPVVSIPLGVDCPRDWMGKAPRCYQPPRILFLSRLHPKKAVPDLLQSAARLRQQGYEYELRIAGVAHPIDAAYEASLEALADELGIASSVSFLGWLDGERKQEELQAARLFVLPSYQENFGVAVAEALAWGLPVVVSDQVALAKDIEEAGAGLVVPVGQPEALAEAIGRLLKDEELCRQMGARARQLAETKFSWTASAKALVALYERVVAERGKG